MSKIKTTPRQIKNALAGKNFANEQLAIVRDENEREEQTEGVKIHMHRNDINKLDKQQEEELLRKQMKKKKEILTPSCAIKVHTYETDYRPTFRPPATYLRTLDTGSQQLQRSTSYVKVSSKYDMDDTDEIWLNQYNGNQNRLSAEKFEYMLNRLEVVCQIATERFVDQKNLEACEQGLVSELVNIREVCRTPESLSQDEAIHSLKSTDARLPVLIAVYEYWRQRRIETGKPLLRHFWPQTPDSDKNDANCFRPRKKVRRPQTRRRRDNDFPTYERLKEIRINLESSRQLLHTIVKREKRKMDINIYKCEVKLLQEKLHHEPKQLHDMIEIEAANNILKKERARQDDLFKEVSRMGNDNLRAVLESMNNQDSNTNIKRKRKESKVEWKQQKAAMQLAMVDPPVEPDIEMRFAGSLDLSRLSYFMTIPPEVHRMNCKARIGRGGRIIFDRSHALTRESYCSANVAKKAQ